VSGDRRIERRRNPRLREAYEPACRLLEERMGRGGGADNPRRQHLAQRLLSESFPHLTLGEVDVLSLAVLRGLARRQPT
jgi:hypothetical protein